MKKNQKTIIPMMNQNMIAPPYKKTPGEPGPCRTRYAYLAVSRMASGEPSQAAGPTLTNAYSILLLRFLRGRSSASMVGYGANICSSAVARLDRRPCTNAPSSFSVALKVSA